MDSEVFHRPPDTQPLTLAPLAAYPTTEEDSESTESYISATVEPTPPVDSLPPAEVEFNTGDPRRHESPVDPYPAPSQSELDDTPGNCTLRAPDMSSIDDEHDDSHSTVMM